ncbi:MAG TPA: hypothetical protein VNS57_06280 [Steroidobacteraceae bacterium]|nr:hypothetical protein [Steroidobacteraceae bacterium]
MAHGIPDAQLPDMRRHLHDVNDELSIAVLQLEMMLESGAVEGATRESLEESLDACRKAAESLRQVWIILGPRQPA